MARRRRRKTSISRARAATQSQGWASRLYYGLIAVHYKGGKRIGEIPDQRKKKKRRR